MHRSFHGTLSSRIPYTSTIKSKDVCFRFDSMHPVHCKETHSCSVEPIRLLKRITDDGNITVSLTGWLDPFPKNGNKNQASGVRHYDIAVHKMSNAGESWRMEEGSIASKTVYANSTLKNVVFNLQDEPALYGVTVTTVDVAGNYKKARRIIYYDKSSKLKINRDHKLVFYSASPDTNFTWQTNYKRICLSWTDRYYNNHNVHSPNNVLKKIKQDTHGFYRGIYEQTTGVLPVSGTVNVNGIVQFYYRHRLDNNTFSNKYLVHNFTQQKLCESFSSRDGETYTFEIQSVDLKSQVLSEQRTVYIDASVPDINNIWLVKEGKHRQLFVHNSTELFKMNLEFDVLDLHSGIYTIHWALGTTTKGTDLGQGAVGVQRLKVN